MKLTKSEEQESRMAADGVYRVGLQYLHRWFRWRPLNKSSSSSVTKWAICLKRSDRLVSSFFGKPSPRRPHIHRVPLLWKKAPFSSLPWRKLHEPPYALTEAGLPFIEERSKLTIVSTLTEFGSLTKECLEMMKRQKVVLLNAHWPPAKQKVQSLRSKNQKCFLVRNAEVPFATLTLKEKATTKTSDSRRETWVETTAGTRHEPRSNPSYGRYLLSLSYE